MNFSVRRTVAFVAMLFFGLLLSACNRQTVDATQQTLETLATVTSNPANGATVSPTTPIVLSFDTPMNPQSVQDASALYVGNYSAVTNPATWTNLQLTAMCDGRWRVRNTNVFSLAFTWDVYGKTEKGIGVAAPSTDTFFYTSKGSKTVRLFVNNKQQQVKASNSTVCADAPFTFVWNAGNTSVTITPNTPLLPLTTYTYVLGQGALTSSNALALSQAFQTTFTTIDAIARKLTVDGSAPCNLRTIAGSFSNYLLMQDVNNNVLSDTLQLGDISFADVKVLSATEQELSTATLTPTRIITRPNENNAASIVILLDESGSITSFDRQKLRVSAAKALVEKLRPGDEAAIAVFGNTNVQVFQTFTTDKTLLNSALDRVTGSSSSAYASLLSTIKLFEGRTNPGKAIIMLTDGQAGSTDTLNFADVVTKANAQNIRLFPIGFANGVRPLQFLSWLACETNGAYDKIERPEALESIFKALTNQLLTDGTNLESTISFATALPGKNNYILRGTTNVRVAGQTVTSPFSIPFSIQDPVPSAPTLETLTPNTGPTIGGFPVTIKGTGFLDAAVVSFGTNNVNATVSPANSTQISVTPPSVAVTAAGQIEVKVKTPFGTSNALPYTYYPEYYAEIVSFTATPASPQVGDEVTFAWQVRDQGGDPLSCILKTNDGTQYQIADCIATTSQKHVFTSIPTTTTATLTVNDTKYNRIRNLTVRVVAAEPTPKLNSLSVNVGPSTGGGQLIITGENLSNVTSVKFGSIEATSFTIDSATQITTTIPAGSGNANVTASSLRGGTSNALVYAYVGLPVISSFAPASAVPGATVTVNGSRLDRVSVLNFGSATVPFTTVSSTRLTFVAPNTAPGSINITVVSPGGTSAAKAFTLLPAPVPSLTAISPVEGPTSGATEVVLTGVNLTNVKRVDFGSVSASYTVNSDTQITALSPSNTAGNAAVKAVADSGESNLLTFTYIAPQIPEILTFETTEPIYEMGESAQFAWTFSNPSAAINWTCTLTIKNGQTGNENAITVPCADGSYSASINAGSYEAKLRTTDGANNASEKVTQFALLGSNAVTVLDNPSNSPNWNAFWSNLPFGPSRFDFHQNLVTETVNDNVTTYTMFEKTGTSYLTGAYLLGTKPVSVLFRVDLSAIINGSITLENVVANRRVTINNIAQYVKPSDPNLEAPENAALREQFTQLLAPLFPEAYTGSSTGGMLMAMSAANGVTTECKVCLSSAYIESYVGWGLTMAATGLFIAGGAVFGGPFTTGMMIIGGVSTASGLGLAITGVIRAELDYSDCKLTAGDSNGFEPIGIIQTPLGLAKIDYFNPGQFGQILGSCGGLRGCTLDSLFALITPMQGQLAEYFELAMDLDGVAVDVKESKFVVTQSGSGSGVMFEAFYSIQGCY